ncbi:M1 family metallopeptidase [Winogradskyella aquimaris]|uniref:Aminopeptidase N n=1 Tax=Winogradskyella aquimaris TaxID=864074 RepID=A0ABU5EPI2_9FLAO|nr:M1 family metallopeptidase [Winogradskyella aquimaris]MDY2587977.1 M1 family metallopeptidase [Winogradskyella aquimaris]
MKKILVVLFLFQISFCAGQQTQYVDFLSLEASIGLEPDSSSVYGAGVFKFMILKPIDSVFIDAKGFKLDMAIPERVNNGLKYSYDGSKIWLKGNFAKDSIYNFHFEYEATPKKALYFVNKNGESQIWTQGQGKYTSNWLPSLDDVNDKIEFDLSITYDKDYEVVANGKLTKKQTNDSTIVWRYDMQKPMSSYLVALVVGKYNKKTETSKSGIPLEYYYYPEDSLKVEPTYRYSKEMFDFLEEEIGFAYPWQNYKQVPVHDFLYAGMENTSCTIFSDAFMVDDIGFNDKNYVNVNAHELAHQWFGDLLTATSGEHHWLQEGFATYYALLAEREIFGDNHYYFKLYESAVDLGRQDLSGKGTSLLNPKSSSLTFYQRGAWVLHTLRSLVGDVPFKQAVKAYLENHQFATVETSDFIKEVEWYYGKPLNAFVNVWIKQKDFPVDAAFGLLQEQSTFINEYLMVDCEAKTSKCKDYLRYYASDDAKVKVISQVPELVTKDTFKQGLKVRQAISQYVRQVPMGLKEDYESLLDDKSYITIENALYNLWTTFPEERAKYLSKTRNVVGFNDKNVRLLWIALNLNTPFYQADSKQELFEELVSYTDEHYNADLRMNAFNYLNLMNACNDICKSNLKKASSHHNWRMVKFAKDMLEKLENKQ